MLHNKTVLRTEEDRRTELSNWASQTLTSRASLRQVAKTGVLLRTLLGLRLLFFAEFLEARIIPEWIEHWIKLKQRGSERHDCTQCAGVRYRK